MKEGKKASATGLKGTDNTTTTTNNMHTHVYETVNMGNIGYTPIEDGLVVEHIKMDKTTTGVYLPQSAQERNNVIKVLAISEEVYKRTPIRVGNLIYLATSRPLPVLEIGDKEYLQARISDVLGIVHE